MTISLEKLVEVAREKTAADRLELSASDLAARVADCGALERRGGRLVAALQPKGIHVIAEVKGASPVAGRLRADYDPVAIASEYQAAGAAAISVLTEETYFGGSLAALESIAAAVDIPVLRKDFIVESYQLQQAALAGAAAVLLIAEVLTPAQLQELTAEAHALRLDALVEIHRSTSIPRAHAAGSGILGVNNRDLDTMEVDWHHAIDVASDLPEATVLVAESGLSSGAQLRQLHGAGYDAALVGSSLMSAPEPGAALQTLLAEARS